MPDIVFERCTQVMDSLVVAERFCVLQWTRPGAGSQGMPITDTENEGGISIQTGKMI